jgi:hypothetical protein
VVDNLGAVTDRWRIEFTNSTTFRVIGESTGELAGAWNTSTPTAPINPATLAPYFTIPAAGWGGGWSAGNVFRFNTTGTSAPLWVARVTQPSDPFAGPDSIMLGMRGDTNT